MIGIIIFIVIIIFLAIVFNSSEHEHNKAYVFLCILMLGVFAIVGVYQSFEKQKEIEQHKQELRESCPQYKLIEEPIYKKIK